jgi:hypothetical protein
VASSDGYLGMEGVEGEGTGVQDGHEAAVAGIGGLQHVQDLGSANLADDDPVWAHAQGVADDLAQWDLASTLDVGWARLEPDDVRAGETQLGSVLDRDHALSGGDRGGEDVEEGRLAGSGRTRHRSRMGK